MTNMFIKKIENKVKKTIKDYKLCNKKEKILVACSGGKDSTTILYILKKLGYNVEAITVNAVIGNYSQKSLDNLVAFCKKHSVVLHLLSFRDEFGYSLCYLRKVINSKGHKLKSCTICGVLRRYLLNRKVRKLKASKIVTGHNLDDEAQAVMMNFLRGSLELNARMGPMTGIVRHSSFVPRIKPLYFCTENEVERYSKLMKFPVSYKECPCRTDVYRNMVRKELNKLEKTDADVKANIIKSYLKLLPKLKKHFKAVKEPNNCNMCGEPAKKEVCQSCNILGLVKK